MSDQNLIQINELKEDLLPKQENKPNPQSQDLLPPIDPNQITYYNQEPVNSPKYTDSNDSEDEGLSSYKVNGYHPVHVGEVLLERYIIMQKLGFGLMMKLKYYKN